MTLDLVRRSSKGAPLTASDHDRNLDRIERAIGPTIIHASMVGALPGASHAATNGAAFQSAMDALAARGGGEFHLTPGAHYCVQDTTTVAGARRGAFVIPSGVRVIGHGATVQHTGLQHGWSGALFMDAQNAGIENVRFLGNHAGYWARGRLDTGAPNSLIDSWAGGQHEFGVFMIGSRRITVRDVHCDQFALDGFYIGTIGSPSGRKSNDDVLFETISAGFNGRQGMSLISARNLLVRNALFHETRGIAARQGTAPGDGVDIEPNTPDEVLENILFENVRTHNNEGGAITTWLKHPNETTRPFSIVVRNLSSRRDRYGLRFRQGHGPNDRDAARLKGAISCANINVFEPRHSGFSYEDMAGIDTFIDGLCVEFNSTLAPDGAFHHPVHIGHRAGNAPGAGTERLTLRGLNVQGTARYPLHLRATAQPYLRDIDIAFSDLGPKTCATGRIYARAMPATASGIRIRASEGIALLNPRITAAADRTYQGHLHTPVVKMAIAEAYRLGNLPVGGPDIVIRNDRDGAAETVEIRAHTSGGQVAGACFSPGGAVGGGIVLAGRGAWVRVLRLSATEFRIVEGTGWAPVA